MNRSNEEGEFLKQIVRNYALFLIGLFIASMGVALSTKAGLGTSPVASVPYSVSLINHTLTFGWWLNLWSVIQIIVQVALLRKKCKPVEIIIQTILAFVYGSLTDFSCTLISGVQENSYAIQFVKLLCTRLRNLDTVQGQCCNAAGRSNEQGIQ